MRLTTNKVLELFNKIDRDYLTYKDLIDAYGVPQNTASKQLSRMKDRRVLWTPDRFDQYKIMTLRDKVIEYWKSKDHVALNCLPEKYGGKVTGGSGQATMFNYLMNTLEEMDIL